MTLMNHVGVYLILCLIMFFIAVKDEELKNKEILPFSFAGAFILFFIMECFYWIIKIFFINDYS